MEHSVFRIELVALQIAYAYKGTRKREYYQNECVECGWSVRQLERQINSFYYERILATSEGKKQK